MNDKLVITAVRPIAAFCTKIRYWRRNTTCCYIAIGM